MKNNVNEEVKKELSRVIGELKENTKNGRLNVAIETVDIGFREQFDVLALLQHLGYGVKLNEKAYVIDLTKTINVRLWLTGDFIKVTNEYDNAETVRHLASIHTE